MLYGDGQTHGKYEFSLNEDGTDYDWDHATNVDTQEQIALAPEEGDTDAQAALDAFHQDNDCYTIEDVDGNTVTDPQGILYMTANSASGSKYYELLSTQQDYVAARSQNWLPSYSVITMTADTFSIETYQITDDGKVESIDDAFTIQKTDAGAAASDASADTTDASSEAADTTNTTDTSADTTDSVSEETDSSDDTDASTDNADGSADAAAETSEN